MVKSFYNGKSFLMAKKIFRGKLLAKVSKNYASLKKVTKKVEGPIGRQKPKLK